MRKCLRRLRECGFGFFVVARAGERVCEKLARNGVGLRRRTFCNVIAQVLRGQILIRLFLRAQIRSDDERAVRFVFGERGEFLCRHIRVMLIERDERRTVVVDRRDIDHGRRTDMKPRALRECRQRRDVRTEQRSGIAAAHDERCSALPCTIDLQHEFVAFLAHVDAKPLRRVGGVGDRTAQARARGRIRIRRRACDRLFDATARNHADRCVVTQPCAHMFVDAARDVSKCRIAAHHRQHGPLRRGRQRYRIALDRMFDQPCRTSRRQSRLPTQQQRANAG